MRVLQLSDPHLVAADQGLVRGRPALAHFERALQVGGALNPDLVLVTGDLCQDESWGGYARLRQALSQHVRCPVALLPGNNDHPLLLDLTPMDPFSIGCCARAASEFSPFPSATRGRP